MPAWIGRCSGICATAPTLWHNLFRTSTTPRTEPRSRRRHETPGRGSRRCPTSCVGRRRTSISPMPTSWCHGRRTAPYIRTASSTSATCPTRGRCPSWRSRRRGAGTSRYRSHVGAACRAGLPRGQTTRPSAEVDALWPLLVLRTAVLIVSGAQQASIDPDNDYVTEQSDGEWRMFELATSVPIDVMTAVIRADLGLAGQPEPVAGSLVAVDPSSVATLDLSTASDAYDFAFDPDGALRPGVEDDAARAAVRNGAHLVVTQYGQPRLSRTHRLSHDSPDVVPTGISVWAATATTLAAPWDGECPTDPYVARLRIRTDVDRRGRRVGQRACRRHRWPKCPRRRGSRSACVRSARRLRRRSPVPNWRPAGSRSPVIHGRCSGCLQSTRTRRVTCCRAATRVSLRCRSFTTAGRRRSNAADGTT